MTARIPDNGDLRAMSDADLAHLGSAIAVERERRYQTRLRAEVDKLRKHIADGLAGTAAADLQNIRDMFSSAGIDATNVSSSVAKLLWPTDTEDIEP